MSGLKTYSLQDISKRLSIQDIPLSGITELGSSEFQIREPVSYAGVAMHSGHRIRSEMLDILAINEKDRFREEDTHTDMFISRFPIQIIARDSRFEYDLNWEVNEAIYDADKKKWGLQVWKRKITEQERKDTLSKYNEFHALLDIVAEFIIKQQQRALIFDIHSFCYQRENRLNWFESNMPDINLGTKALEREHFAVVIDLLLEKLSGIRVDGHLLKVVENELFPGGYLSRKYSSLYPDKVLVLSLEYKKLYMDEWTGKVYKGRLDQLTKSFSRIVREVIPFFAKY